MKKIKCCRVQKNCFVQKIALFKKGALFKKISQILLAQSEGLNTHEPSELPPYPPFASRADRCYTEYIELNNVAKHNSRKKLAKAGGEYIQLSIKPNSFIGLLQRY
jgi:hypothetical protein